MVLFIMGGVASASYFSQRRLAVDLATYQPLLQLIARVESHDNYNAYFGSPGNHTVDFTSMTIAEVMQWQASYLAQGSPSDAVGRYQIISPTLTSLIQELDVDMNRLFDQSTQDMFAHALLSRRGGERYVNNELSSGQFAANIAQEWAAFPRVIGDDPASSYYASDGLNKSLVSVDEVLAAIKPIKPKR